MPTHVTNQASLLDAVLPENPKTGDVYTVPEGQQVGGAQVINIHYKQQVIGNAQFLSAVTNVSGAFTLTKVTTDRALKRGDIIHVVGTVLGYDKVTFTQYYGWAGTWVNGLTSKIHDNKYKVIDTTYVAKGTTGPTLHVYERICLQAINKE